MITPKLSQGARIAFAVISLALAACNHDDKKRYVPPAAPPPPADTTAATFTVETALGIRENIVITFSEAMDPTTLTLSGLLADLADDGSWNGDNTQLTLSPNEGSWESGPQTVTGSIEDLAGNVTTLDTDFEVRLTFDSFQAASVVIGQPDFESSSVGLVDANTLDSPYGIVTFSEGRMWVPDYSNNRMLGFDGVPEVSNASATWVVGQPDFVSESGGTSDSAFRGPQTGIEHDGRFYMLEYSNNRITIFGDIPLTPPAVASNVIGQPDLTSSVSSCSASGLNNPEIMVIADGKLIVADAGNNRVLIWNTVPTAANGEPADLVLGQNSMDSCVDNDDDQDGTRDATPSARTLAYASAVWSDGQRLVVGDIGNNRVLIWNTFPTSNFQPADVVLGQSSFANGTSDDRDQDGTTDSASEQTLDGPYESVWSNGLQLFVGDSNNNRVLIWNEFPTENFQAADVVLGQSTFENTTRNDDNQDNTADATPTARTLDYPVGGGVYRDKLVVLDLNNNRALVFDSK